jgi:hypothetical protein
MLQAIALSLTLVLESSAPAPPAIEGYPHPAAFAGRVQALDGSPHAVVTILQKLPSGREVQLITISAGDADRKPAILIVGSVHAPHLVGGELAVRIAQRLAGDNDESAALRERFTFYVIPHPSPDATAAFYRTPYTERTVNARPEDEDNDAATDEDGPDDLDGDGFITTMRIEDAAGEMMSHPDDARLLIKADRTKGERGVYKLHVEGIDNDKDGRFNEDATGGTAFDRNFTFDYPYFEPGAGPHQVSEPETRAMADFAFDHPNIAAVIGFGVNDNLAQPWKPSPQAEQPRIKTTLLAEDAPYYDFIVDKYRKLAEPRDPPASGDGEGSFVKWAYFHYGRWAFESRAWWVPKVGGAVKASAKEGDGEERSTPPAQASPRREGGEQKPDARTGDLIHALKWFEQNNIPAFAPWTEVKHPDFADRKVEVGGLKPFYLINPPADRLDALAETHYKFIAEVAGLLPTVSISDVKTEPLGGQTFRITATFLNSGYLPTMSAMGRTNRAPYPLNVTLNLPQGTTLLTGHPRIQLAPIPGSGGQQEQVWIVRSAPAELTITVDSPAVGSASRKVTLP